MTPRKGSAEPEDAVPLLQELIRTACVNDGSDGSGQEIRAVRILQDYLAGLDVDMEVIEPKPGRANLIATLKGARPGSRRLVLLGHLDVVPADPARWAHDPFGGELLGGEVWGRGAVDMLSLVAAMAVAFRILVQRVVRLDGDVVFAATADEEAGSRYGMRWLFENRPDLVRADFALTESGGGVVLGGGQAVTITTGQKGSAGRRITVRGQTGHGSMPYGVHSGALLAAEVVARIAAHRAAPVIPQGDWWPDLLGALGFDDGLRARLSDAATLDAALEECGPLARLLHALTHMTFSPNVLRAGTKMNVIPSDGVIDVDIRLLPGQTDADADAELARVLSGLPGEVSIEPGPVSARPLQTARDDDLYRTLCEVIDEFYPGAAPLPLLTPGGNDARQYLSRGTPCYGFGLLSPEIDLAAFRSRFHGDNERIDARSVQLCTEAYLRIAERLLASPPATDTE